MLGIGVSLRHLRGTTAAVDAYKVASFKPDLVFDFEQEYYRTGGTQTTFDSAITHTRNSNATMVDSDGLLKWAPHNLLTYSEQFDNVDWNKASATATPNAGVAPNGTVTADRFTVNSTGTFRYARQSPSLVQNDRYTVTMWFKYETSQFVWLLGEVATDAFAYFDIQNGVLGATVGAGVTSSISAAGDGWYRCSMSFTKTSASALEEVGFGLADANGNPTATAGISALAWGAHLYRSDLGGMVNNPDRGDSYVPTTSAARYLPRRGHHVYNGAEWVNEGVLVEPTAATNLITHSSEFDNAAWGAASVNLTANAAVAPDGTSTAYEWEATSAIYASVFDTVTTVNGTPYTGSVYAKAGTVSTLGLEIRGSGITPDTIFDLSTGTITSGSGTIEDAGNGWYRCSITEAAVDTSELFIIGRGVSGSIGDTIYLWGAQFEASSTPSSYIPTSGSTVTRAADDADSDNLTYDSSAMWFTLSGLQTFADEGVVGQEVLFDWRADANNRITLTIDTDGAETGEITLTVVSGGTTWSVAQDYLSPGVNVPFSIAWRVTDTEINIAAGGTSATAVPTTSIPDLSSASAAFDGNGVYSLFRQGVGDIGDSGIEGASA